MKNFIQASEISQWAKTQIDAQSDLPFLTKKLIRATADSISKIEIPIGKGIHIGGWDGIVISKEDYEFVPVGLSLWEFGIEPAAPKAEKEYHKRTTNPLGYDTTNSTFIFVTPHIWTKKTDWVKEKLALGNWKDIRVYDAQNIEEWLNQDALTSKWFAEKVFGYSSSGYDSIENFWAVWSLGIDGKVFPTQLLTNNRKGQFQTLLNNLSTSNGLVELLSGTKDESIAFLCASILECEDIQKEHLLASAIIVHDKPTFEQIAYQKQSKLLIPTFDDLNICNTAVAKGHKVIIPSGADYIDSETANIRLNRLDREETIQAIRKLGYTDNQARQLSKDSCRNISILRRLMGFEKNKPTWASKDNSNDFIPALLIGRWDDVNENDKALLADIAGVSYDTYIQNLSRWLNIPDAPILKIGTKWRVSSSFDLIKYIGLFISPSELTRFKNCFIKVFQELNPELELSPDKRMSRSLYGKNPIFTDWCREGMGQSLVLIAIYGDTLKLPVNGAQSWVDGIIYELLKDCSGPLWCSLSSVYTHLAEASPDYFLKAIEKSLNSDEKTVLTIFNEAKEGIFGDTGYYINMLWALESLAWETNYLSRVTKILILFSSQNDIPENYANRPINSLRHIFLPWLPQTHARFEDRLEIIDAISSKYPEKGWELLQKILPEHHDTGGYNRKYNWRPYEEEELPKVSYPQLFKVWSGLIDIALKIADKNDFTQLIRKIHDFSPEDRRKIIEYGKSKIDNLSHCRVQVWETLNDIIVRHKKYADKEWALPADELEQIEELYHLYKPEKVIDQIKWLFNDSWPDIIPQDTSKPTREQREEDVENARVEGLKGLYEIEGAEALLAMARNVQHPYILGRVASKVFEDREELFLRLKSSERSDKYFLEGFFRERFISLGFEWIIQTFKNLYENGYSMEQLATLLISIPSGKEVWTFVESYGTKLEESYWQNINDYLAGLSGEEQVYGLKKLLQYQRLMSAIDSGSYGRKNIPTELICDILLKTASEPSIDESRGNMTGYHIEQLFEELYERKNATKDTMIQLEWIYMHLIFSNRNDFRPKSYIYQEIGDNPEFFVEILKAYYPPENAPKTNEFTEEEKDKIMFNWKRGYEIFHHLDKIPGVDEESKIDSTYLNNWVKNVFELADKCSRKNGAEFQIGHLLAQHNRLKENYPSDEICAILENYSSEKMIEGFNIGAFNGNGVNVVMGADGGHRFLSRSAYYLEQSKRKAKYPAVSALLKDLSDSYKNHSKYEQERDKEDDLEF